jgi:hypothetical protein
MELEKQFLAFRGMEITLLEQEGKIRQLESELEMWKDRCKRLEEQKTALEKCRINSIKFGVELEELKSNLVE